MNNKKYNKKTISPVVATALLIVVAVVSVVGFQTWFGDFSSGVFSNTETQSENNVGNTQIDSVIGSSAYFNNAGTENITITEVKVDRVDCNITTNATTGISELDISDCLANATTSTPEIVIYTNEGIYSKNFYSKNLISTSTNQINTFQGIEIWNKSISGIFPRKMVVDTDENIYIASIFNDDYLILKYDSSGNYILNISSNTLESESTVSIALDTNNNLYVATDIWGGASSSDYLILKYDSNGNYIWNRTISSNFSDYPYAIITDINSNVYVTGQDHKGGAGIIDYYTIKYDTNGNHIWNSTHSNGGLFASSNAIAVDTNENVYVTGQKDNGTSEDFFTIKYDSNGNELWNATYDGGIGNDCVMDIFIDDQNYVYIVGYIFNGVNDDIYIIKYG